MKSLGYYRTRMIQHAIKRFGIKCSICEEGWMVGDEERTEEEKTQWICPRCKDRKCIECGEGKDERTRAGLKCSICSYGY